MLDKNKKKEEAKKQRCLVAFNIGTRSMKSPKDYDRKKSKKDLKKALDY